jgi:hypothetical protein
LIKVGGRPGIPVSVQLTSIERTIHDTNRLWHEQSRVSSNHNAVPGSPTDRPTNQPEEAA